MQLVMTPQLQLAIRLLSTPSHELRSIVDAHLAAHPGTLVDLAPGEPDPLDVADEETGATWSFATASPLGDQRGDVWVHGNPPVARANGHATPRVKPVGDDRDAIWLARALRQRARSYERIVAALVERRPRIAITSDGSDIEPLALRELADAVGMHESTIDRIAKACTIANLHGLLQLHRTGGKRAALRVTGGRR